MPFVLKKGGKMKYSDEKWVLKLNGGFKTPKCKDFNTFFKLHSGKTPRSLMNLSMAVCLQKFNNYVYSV